MEEKDNIKDKKENTEEKEVVVHENTEKLKLDKMQEEDINIYFQKKILLNLFLIINPYLIEYLVKYPDKL